MNTTTPVTALLTLTLTLAACSTPQVPVAEVETETDTTTEVDPIDADADADPGPTTLDLVGTHTFNDDVSVQISEVRRLERSEMSTPTGEPFVAFTMKWTNGSQTQLDMSMLSTTCTVGQPGRGVDTVYDDGHDVDPWIGSTLLPGDEVVATYGCEMEPDDQRLQIELALWQDEHDYNVIFTGEVE